jgi:hypothetical protein
MIPLELPLYDLDGWTGNATDDYGVDWIITSEEGWSGAVDAQAAIEDRPDGDGADDAPTYEATRVITLTGTPSRRTGPRRTRPRTGSTPPPTPAEASTRSRSPRTT